jgi:nucleoside-diphosphate-sugar epimerase
LVEAGRDVSGLRRLGAETVEGDLSEPESLEQALDGVETVFHAAGVIHPRFRTADLFKVNVQGTQNLLAASVKAGVRRFCFVSSNSVGGSNLSRERLMTEDDPPRPYRAYGRSKAQAEEHVRRYHQDGLLETVIIRPCWYYGPGQPPRQTRFFNMIKSGKPLIFGDGRNLRSMSYIDNTVQGLILAAQSEAASGQTYWISDERPYRTIEIYETVARLLDVSPFKPRFLPNFVSDFAALGDGMVQAVGLYQMELHVAGEMNDDIACSMEKARRELGYCPTTSLEEGMRRSIEWCRSRGIEL